MNRYLIFIFIFLLCPILNGMNLEQMPQDLISIANDMYSSATPKYIYFSDNINKKQSTMKPSQVYIDSAKFILKQLDNSNKKTAIYYCSKYLLKRRTLKSSESNTLEDDEVNTAMYEVVNDIQHIDVNIVIVFHIWVDHELRVKNSNPKDDKLQEKIYLYFVPSQDIDQTCTKQKFETIKTNISLDKKNLPLYSNNALMFLVKNIKKEFSLCPKLTNDAIKVKLMTSGKLVPYNGSVYMTSEPQMPKFYLSLDFSKTTYKKIFVKVSVLFYHQFFYKGIQRVRQRTINYPVHNEKHFVFDSCQSTYVVDMKDQFITGPMKVSIYEDKECTKVLKEFKCYIKGTNPTEKQIFAYIDQLGYRQKYWFLEGIIHVESLGSGGQFSDKRYNYTVVGQKVSKIKGYPNFGYPDGWGIMQLDDYENATVKNTDIDYLFNWKANIDKGLKLIDGKINNIKYWTNTKIVEAKKVQTDISKFIPHADTIDGGITYAHIKSNLSNISNMNDYYYDPAEVGKYSFLDACYIKSYNGGLYYFPVGYTFERYVKWEILNYGKSGSKIIYYVQHVSDYYSH